MVRGLARGCDVALRPHGRAMADPREAQVALMRCRRPRGWVHMGALWGATWQVRMAVGGPTGILGP